ncbi:MAG: hypothetical protein P4M11_11710 [Candidatus Pacebacteria bacterium]|nr:hypothetical protein [Candidatus Paceibacterota bacterium]
MAKLTVVAMKNLREKREEIPDFKTAAAKLVMIIKKIDAANSKEELACKEVDANEIYAELRMGEKEPKFPDISNVMEIAKRLASIERDMEEVNKLAKIHIFQFQQIAVPVGSKQNKREKIKAKFSDEDTSDYYGGVWKIGYTGLTCKKIQKSDVITICALDTVLSKGKYEVTYRLEKLESAYEYDSIGISVRESLSCGAFGGKHMYGIFSQATSANSTREKIKYDFTKGDVVTLIYDSMEATLEFLVNGAKMGSTIRNIPKAEYVTGVAFRNIGTAIRLVSFVHII